MTTTRDDFLANVRRGLRRGPVDAATRQQLEAPGAEPMPDWPARFVELAAAARDTRLQAFYAAGAVAGGTRSSGGSQAP